MRYDIKDLSLLPHHPSHESRYSLGLPHNWAFLSFGERGGNQNGLLSTDGEYNLSSRWIYWINFVARTDNIFWHAFLIKYPYWCSMSTLL
jgi:hypothetical protein